ncbi:MAG: hypothetical protein FWC92_11060 [Defluviitaleaceae bacterium]|nr:hypothetical protein [Defluviitaleaceae bacterium]
MYKKIILISVLLLLATATIIFAWQANREARTHYNQDYHLANQVLQQDQPPPQYALEEPTFFEHTTETRAQNLQKLAMVWGFAKYTHLAFITGEKCWDAELQSISQLC